MTNALTRRGHVCAAVSSAPEAVAALSAFRPTIVLIEWAFRDGSGIGLAGRLRARARSENPRLVVIAVSHANEPAELHGEFDDYLVKPASAEEIENVFTRRMRQLRAV